MPYQTVEQLEAALKRPWASIYAEFSGCTPLAIAYELPSRMRHVAEDIWYRIMEERKAITPEVVLLSQVDLR